jgi:hypothetical protein
MRNNKTVYISFNYIKYFTKKYLKTHLKENFLVLTNVD